MDAKRGQISAILIIGLGLLVMAGAVLFLKSQVTTIEEESFSIPESSSMKFFAEECLEKVSKAGIIEIGIKGFTFHAQKYVGETSRTSIFYHNSTKILPSIENTEKELGWYIETNLLECVKSSNIEEKGVSVEYGDTIADVAITQDSIIFDVELPIRIISENATEEFKHISSKTSIRMDFLITEISKFVDSIAADPSSYDLTEMLNYDFDIQVIQLGPYGNLDMYIIRDWKTRVYQDDYSPYRIIFFVFHGGIMPELRSSGADEPIIINEPDTLTAMVGQDFNHTINIDYPYPEKLFFKIETDIKEINPYSDGIYFRPTTDMVGVHNVTIKVQDVERIDEGFIEKKIQLEIR